MDVVKSNVSMECGGGRGDMGWWWWCWSKSPSPCVDFEIQTDTSYERSFRDRVREKMTTAKGDDRMWGYRRREGGEGERLGTKWPTLVKHELGSYDSKRSSVFFFSGLKFCLVISQLGNERTAPPCGYLLSFNIFFPPSLRVLMTPTWRHDHSRTTGPIVALVLWMEWIASDRWRRQRPSNWAWRYHILPFSAFGSGSAQHVLGCELVLRIHSHMFHVRQQTYETDKKENVATPQSRLLSSHNTKWRSATPKCRLLVPSVKIMHNNYY